MLGLWVLEFDQTIRRWNVSLVVSEGGMQDMFDSEYHCKSPGGSCATRSQESVSTIEQCPSLHCVEGYSFGYGYRVLKSGQFVCPPEGIFFPSCQPLPCQDPEIHHGTVGNCTNLVYKDICYPECGWLYKLSGPIRCSVDGEATPSSPCERNWHLIYIVAVALLALVLLAFYCFCFWLRGKRRMQKETKKEMERQLQERIKNAVTQGSQIHFSEVRSELSRIGWNTDQFQKAFHSEEVAQSENGGICVALVSSDEFLNLAKCRSGEEDPSFYDLKDGFFFGPGALGELTPCPRDNKPGCALIDYFPRKYRRKCSHFMSWSWGYKVIMVQSSLASWCSKVDLDPTAVFLYCCFFCNNQYRILVAGNGNGSENLEDVFEKRLKDIGQVVALLDTWDNPRYLTRVWTIFEQFTAIKLNIEVTVILPPESEQSLIQKIEQGSSGISDVTMSLKSVDSNSAEAFSPDDLKKVRGLIEKDIGFQELDHAVALNMVKWVGTTVHNHFADIVNGSFPEKVKMKIGETSARNDTSYSSTPLLDRSNESIEMSVRRQPMDNAGTISPVV